MIEVLLQALFIQGCFSAANLTTVVSKCCDFGQVYYEMSSECGEGSFNLTALRSKHMADDVIADSDDNEIYFDTGAVKAEDCENGSLRCVYVSSITGIPLQVALAKTCVFLYISRQPNEFEHTGS